MFASLFAFSLGLPLAWGHFNLKYPATIGFDDEKQHDGPCGGFTPDFSKNNITDFHVNGDAIATLTTHKQGNWLYRITLDETASGDWTQIFPIVQQNGLGAFCEPAVSVPPRFVGQRGVLGIVSNTPDGILFQVGPSFIARPLFQADYFSFVLVCFCPLRKRQYRLSCHLPECIGRESAVFCRLEANESPRW